MHPGVTGRKASSDSEVVTHLRRYLTVGEAANYLTISTSMLNKLRVTGGGPAYLQLGRAIRYEPDALDDWARSQRKSSTSQNSGTAA